MNTDPLTTYYLYASVHDWEYTYEQPKPGASPVLATSRLNFDVILDDNDILPNSLSLGLCIIYDTDDVENELSTWQLDLIKDMDEPPIYNCSEGLLTLAETPFLALKEVLFHVAKSNYCELKLHLAVQELPPNEFAERSFAIVEFGYTLHHQKVNR